LIQQVETVKTHQLDHHKKLAASFRVIDHDVARTDRNHDAFRANDGVGLAILKELLRAYCIYNENIGYLQGMNDLFVPIIHAYFPRWKPETGQPIDEAGDPVEYRSKLPIIFWNFDGMLKCTDHTTLLSSVTVQCLNKAHLIGNIISKVSPLVDIWMRKYGLGDLLWMYSDLVLLFKRSFPDIWGTWLQLSSAPLSTEWLTYFVAAIMLSTFPTYSALPDVQITSIMDVFTRIMSEIVPADIGKIALWLYSQYQLEPKPAESSSVSEHFDFFRPAWAVSDA
jgi:hypothetical protein